MVRSWFYISKELAPDSSLVVMVASMGTAADEELGVLRERSGLLLNSLVHPWLGEARLVGFVVSVHKRYQ
jgi:hypothetical protein